MPCLRALAAVLGLLVTTSATAQEPKRLKVLFLGDNGGHKRADRYRQLEPVLAGRGVERVYTDKADALSEKTLAADDALIVYANSTRVTPEQEKAALDFVERGSALGPLRW